MNYSSDHPADKHPDEPVLVKEAGVIFQPRIAADPIAAWLDLMDVVEALCPVWPEPEKPAAGNHWLL